MIVNWTQDEWFLKNHYDKVTSEFDEWWYRFYGGPGDYDDPHEYFVRASFALTGWLAHKAQSHCKCS